MKNKILSHNYSTDLPDFRNIEINVVGLFEIIDSDGKTNYRGNIDYNYVSFAGYLWRIIRINGDGSVRVIMDGDIGISTFNNTANMIKYSGYTYDKETSETNSTIKTYLENWYEKNLKKYDNYIAISKYCNDTSIYTGDINSTTSSIVYEAVNRLKILKQSTLICNSTTSSFGGEYL